MKFNKSKLAAAIGAAALATSMQAGAVVVVGGDNGWEISFDGTINLFYNQIDRDLGNASSRGLAKTTSGGLLTSFSGKATATVDTGNSDSAHLNEGLLPAFFSFNAKSPTINGLTGTARISFAPDSSNAKARRQDKAGSAIDMREVVVNVEGSFGTISFGRTLGIFSRQAILKDQTLFGVGAIGGVDGGGTTLGRIGYGYVYPAFDTRFSYKTPVMNGFQVEVGLYDPLEGNENFLYAGIGGGAAGGMVGWETDTPRFEGEATYSTAIGDGNVNLWLGGLWQESTINVGAQGAGSIEHDITHWGVDVGGQVTYMGFELLGHYTTGDNLGSLFKIAAPGVITGGTQGTGDDLETDHWYVQVGYTFNGKTKIAGSYGESNQDESTYTDPAGAIFTTNPEINRDMWTIGVYHDVNSWLKLVAEYNNQNAETTCTVSNANCAGTGTLSDVETDTFSVGAFMFW